MGTVTTSQIDELTALRAENAALRSQLEEIAEEPVAQQQRRRFSSRPLVAVVLVTIGALLAPVAIAATFAAQQATNTDAFVATFSPLSGNAGLQRLVADKTVEAIDQRVNVPQLTGDAFDALAGLNLPPRAQAALQGLRASATAAIEDRIRSTVQDYLASPSFASLWTQLLRTAHSQAVATLTGQGSAAVVLKDDGSVAVQLGPVIAAVKQRLVARGLSFAASIPSVNRTIVVADWNGGSQVRSGYALIVALGAWLPWISLGFLAAGVLVARRRTRALGRAAVALAAASLLLLAAIGIAGVLVVQALSPRLLPSDSVRAIWDGLVAFPTALAVAVTVLAVCVAFVAWFAGSSPSGERVRGGLLRGIGTARDGAERRGITTGRFGLALGRWRVAIRVAVSVIAAAIILFIRPVTPALIIWTLIGALVVIGLSELLSRPAPVPVPVDPVAA